MAECNKVTLSLVTSLSLIISPTLLHCSLLLIRFNKSLLSITIILFKIMTGRILIDVSILQSLSTDAGGLVEMLDSSHQPHPTTS